MRLAKSEPERMAVWKGRKAAFAAVGRISPNYLVQDGVIPRTALPRVLGEIDRLSADAGLRVANVFHAGDGNLHPLVLYDRRIAGQEERAMTLAEDILRLCVDAGGSITGEHGIGEEKKMFMPVMFSPADLDAMQRLRSAFDPYDLCNPTKMFPGTDAKLQRPVAYEPHPIELAGLAQRY
jgi:glycolate oxidase